MFKTNLKQKIKVESIAIEMVKSGVSPIFVDKAMSIALEYEGMADLFELWREYEGNTKERRLTLEAISQEVCELDIT